jgi:hypothetical protein
VIAGEVSISISRETFGQYVSICHDNVESTSFLIHHHSGTINRTLKNKICKDTLMKFYKIMAVPVLSYGSESWVTSKKIRTRYKLQR